jgi:hypothetical protein
MSSLLEGSDQLERELTPDPIAAPAAGSLVLHGVLFASLLFYGMLNGFFHHNLWGNPGAGGAIQVSLVSNALPLPADQPVNKNVLATETPSQAPAAPTPKAKQAADETAIPISGKQQKPQQETARKTQQHQPQLKQDNRAQFGEQAGTFMPRSTMAQPGSANDPVNVANGDFGTRFPRPRATRCKSTSRSIARASRPASRSTRPAAAPLLTGHACWLLSASIHLGTCPRNPTINGSTSLMIVRIESWRVEGAAPFPLCTWKDRSNA